MNTKTKQNCFFIPGWAFNTLCVALCHICAFSPWCRFHGVLRHCHSLWCCRAYFIRLMLSVTDFVLETLTLTSLLNGCAAAGAACYEEPCECDDSDSWLAQGRKTVFVSPHALFSHQFLDMQAHMLLKPVGPLISTWIPQERGSGGMHDRVCSVV